MTEVKWDEFGEKVFEAGLDRGVLYPLDSEGVPWNGLISVADKPDGNAPEAYYFDGVKYLNIPSITEFAATLSAYTYPEEFEQSDGMGTTDDGVGIDNQPNKEFNLSYRTKIGNDANGLDFAYKVHLVYNALASPSDKTYQTLDASPEATDMTWDLTTRPENAPGYKPTGHLVLDTRKLSGSAMLLLENLLYGRLNPPRIPLPDEVILVSKMHVVYIIASPDGSLLPRSAGTGDLAFSVSDQAIYAINSYDSDVRPAFVVDHDYEINPYAASLMATDLVYNQTTGILYKIGGV